jgi:hypothetical protein
MAASESTKFQVNFKLADGTLVNLYAQDSAELESSLTTIQDTAALIHSVSQSLGSAPQTGGYRRSFTPQPTSPVAQSAPAESAPVVVEGQSPSCKHGTMTFRSGTSARGPWKGWMCAAPKGAADKCQTIWA